MSYASSCLVLTLQLGTHPFILYILPPQEGFTQLWSALPKQVYTPTVTVNMAAFDCRAAAVSQVWVPGDGVCAHTPLASFGGCTTPGNALASCSLCCCNLCVVQPQSVMV